MDTGALIITAGKTNTVMGMDPMLQVGSISVVQRLCTTFHLAGISPIVVVMAKEEQKEIEQHLARMPVVFIPGLGSGDEMFQGVKSGLEYFKNGKTKRIFITPVSTALFSAETIKTLLKTEEEAAVPIYKGQKGHPLLLGTSLIGKILDYNGDRGLRGALCHSGISPACIKVEDPGVYIHSDQFGECEKIVAEHSLSKWHPLMKLRVAKESAFFGPGSWQLLSLIESTGSVRVASQYMGISYSKAWKILNNMEEQAGYRVLTRQKGGKGGGCSYITDQGKALMEWYENLERLCNQAVNDIFNRIPPPV